MTTKPKRELVHIPTVADLVAQKLAHPAAYTKKGQPSQWTVSPEGQRLIYDAQKHNAAILKKNPDLHQPTFNKRTDDE